MSYDFAAKRFQVEATVRGENYASDPFLFTVVVESTGELRLEDS